MMATGNSRSAGRAKHSLVKGAFGYVVRVALVVMVANALSLASSPVYARQQPDLPSLSLPTSSVVSSSSSSRVIPSSSLRDLGEDGNVDDVDEVIEVVDPKQSEVTEYHLWEAKEFKEALDRWKLQYADLVRVTTSQEEYGLPRAGGPGDCTFDDAADGCPNYILTVQDFLAHPVNSYSSSHLPEVFWSGCLHGDERVGPTSVMEAANLLLEAASCEALPRWNKTAVEDPHSAQSQHSSTIHHSAWQSELEEAKRCRNTLRAKGIDDIHRQWLARLVSTRRIVIVPTANALGYSKNSRVELNIDPNRDFPYDVEDPKDCMRTIAGRTLNEIYRDHMFQLALTFHAGMEVVAYEWGAPSWLNHFSPDDEAQSQVAAAYSRFGGGWSTSKPYAFGTMNEMVYYVRGGMEDWAYAGSWDPTHVIPCAPKEFGGYPKEKTVYNNATLRVFNMLVETSDRKQPRGNELGTSLDVLSRDTGGNGHVSRNIRLSLLAADLVEPYVSIVAINNLALSDDIVPSMNRGGRSCQKTKAVMVPQNSGHAVIEWTVGGAIHVDSTEVYFAKWDDIPEDQLDCLNQPKIMKGFLKGNMVGPMNGTAAFSRAGAHPSAEQATETRTSSGQVPTMGPIFRATIDIPDNWKKLDQIVVVVSARVDQTWAEQPSNVAPKLPPQSHVVNARTNPDWHYESAGKHVQGRLNWYSIPVTIIIGDYEDSVGTSMRNQPIETVERNRFGISRTSGGVRPKAAQQGQLGFPVLSWEFFAIVLSIGLVCLGGCHCCLRQQSGRTGHNKTKSKATHGKEYSGFSDRGGYSDIPEGGDVELPSLS